MTASPTRQHPSTPRRGPGILGVLGRLARGAAHLVGRLGQALTASAVLVGLVAALPWALWHYLGWPLPDHLPTRAEMEAVLLGPLSTPLLLDVLACLCWITWVAFVIDVARCVLAAVRGLRWPELDTRGPLHALAAILVGVIVVSLLSNRSPAAASGGITEALSGRGGVVATATSPAPVLAGPIALVHTIAPPAADGQDVPSVVVRVPEDGIHDSLSRIAARTLGAAGRWPEIFALNQGKPQPHGGRFTNPNLIFPGERLTLPSSTALPTAPAADADHRTGLPTVSQPPLWPAPTSSAPATSPSPVPPTTAPGTTVAPVVPAPHTDTPGSGPGIGWGPGVFVGLGLAAAISGALVATRRRSRRAYRPGSGRRDDLPVAPMVYQLRLAHLRAQHPDACPEGDLDDGDPDQWQAPPLVIGTTPDPDNSARRRVAPGLGVRDGREIALDLAVARGLGLVGAGACAAARALLLTLLTSPPPAAPGAQVILPVEDLALLLGPENAHQEWPAAVRVVADLDAALDELEAEMLRRVREADSDAGSRTGWPVMGLVARPPGHNTHRLQAVLDNGASFGLVGVLLGQWRPGASAYIREDGTVSSASPGPGQALLGTQMFRLPETETADLLMLLRQAQPEPHDCAPTDQDTAAPVSPEACQGEGPPSRSPEQSARTTSSVTTLDAREPTREVIDTALEVTAIAHAEPEHQHDRRSGAAIRCRPVAPGEPAHRDALATPITLTVLGCPRVHWTPETATKTVQGGAAADAATREITAAFPPRQRELLVFLALHPDGVHREALVAALWQDNPPQRPTNALNTALSRLRRSVTQATGGAVSDLITIGESRYQLDSRLADVDYWHFSGAVAARRAAGSEGERITAYERIVAGYRGCLAEGLDTEWIDAPREATRRDALDAVAALARALVDTDPQRTLDLLETARAFDPHNELLYRDIMRLQQRLGHLDAIGRTMTLLTTRLAEIDERPTAQALELAARLQQHHDTKRADPGRRDPRGERRDTAAVS